METIQWLPEQAGATINALTHQGATPLYIAEQYNGAESSVVRYLQSQAGIRQDTFPNTLPRTLAGDGQIDALRALVSKGKQFVQARDDNGWTSLHESARGGHVHVAEYLLTQGATLNAKTKDGGTASYYAAKCQGKESPMYQFLASLGAMDIGPEL
jgi:ankyrin repeat protein